MRKATRMFVHLTRSATTRRRITAFSSSCLLLLSTAIGLASPASAVAAINVHVVSSATEAAISGAVITVAAPLVTPTSSVTNASGDSAVTPNSGAAANGYSVSVSAVGFATTTQTFVAAGATTTFRLEPAVFTPLPIEAGAVKLVRADAQSGVFYALLEQSPDVYRTVDSGAHWQRVTMRYDDPENGLPGSSNAGNVTTSNVPGEVLVNTGDDGNNIWYSKDFGLTWKNLPVVDVFDRGRTDGGDWAWYRPGGGNSEQLVWMHASASALSIVVAVGAVDWTSGGPSRESAELLDVFTAAMDTDPTMRFRAVWETATYGSVFGFADIGGQSRIARLAPSEPSYLLETALISGLMNGSWESGGQLPDGAQPTQLRLANAGTAGLPQALVLTAEGDGAVLVGGGYVTSELTPLPGDCNFFLPASSGRNSVLPISIAPDGAGQVGDCWLTMKPPEFAEAPYEVAVTEIPGGAGVMAYDASWSSNSITFAADGRSAPRKTSTLTSGVPDFSSAVRVGAGIRSGQVADLVYGPADGQMGIAMNDAGGSKQLVSTDDGATWSARDRSATAVQWWQGAAGRQWLAFAERDQFAVTLATDGSELQTVEIPCPDCRVESVTALKAVPGSDQAFFGFNTRSTVPEQSNEPVAVLALATFAETAGTISVSWQPVVFDEGAAPYEVQALSFCPTSGSAAEVADVLLVATSDTQGGSPTNGYSRFYRVSDATGTPFVTLVDDLPTDNAGWMSMGTKWHAIKADCGSGQVYLGGDATADADPAVFWPHTGFYTSIDGGASFNQQDVYLGGMFPNGPVTAIGALPDNPGQIEIYSDGIVGHSVDAGQTWTSVYEKANRRELNLKVIEYMPVGHLAPAMRLAATTSAGPIVRGANRATVGSSNGAATGNLTADLGVVGVRTNDGNNWTGLQLSQLKSDGSPVVAAGALIAPDGAPDNRQLLIVKRADGLYYATFRDGAGVSSPAWTLFRKVPTTSAAAYQPAAAFDSSTGTFWISYRSGESIWLQPLAADGSWSTPTAVSNSYLGSLPAVTAFGGKAAVAFRKSSGVFLATSPRWAAVQVNSTTALDGTEANGGPAVTSSVGGVQVLFARDNTPASKKKPAVLGGVLFSMCDWLTAICPTPSPVRMNTATSTLVDPAVVGDGKKLYATFTGSGAIGAGIYVASANLPAPRNPSRWTSQLLADTSSADASPRIALLDAASQDGLPMVVAQIVWQRANTGIFGRRLSLTLSSLAAQQLSFDPGDANPSLAAGRYGLAVVLFQRG